MLGDAFIEIVNRYAPAAEAAKLWTEVAETHSSPKRAYHNLAHLDHLYQALAPLKGQLADWECVVLAIAYHDFVYNVLRHDNEQKSAAVAVRRLLSFGFPEMRARHTATLIRATKGHTRESAADVNFFTDADLSILGASESKYDAYARAVRKEYAYFPDMLYRAGRKKVLSHFLSMERIFKTEIFFSRFENAARSNLARERDTL